LESNWLQQAHNKNFKRKKYSWLFSLRSTF